MNQKVIAVVFMWTHCASCGTACLCRCSPFECLREPETVGGACRGTGCTIYSLWCLCEPETGCTVVLVGELVALFTPFGCLCEPETGCHVVLVGELVAQLTPFGCLCEPETDCLVVLVGELVSLFTPFRCLCEPETGCHVVLVEEHVALLLLGVYVSQKLAVLWCLSGNWLHYLLPFGVCVIQKLTVLWCFLGK